MLNGAVEMECSGCSGAQFLCRPGEAGYPGATDESPAADAPTLSTTRLLLLVNDDVGFPVALRVLAFAGE